MVWKKLGLVFNPAEHQLPGACVDFAQSPQAVMVGETIRIFFSTRERDEGGKYLSRVTYANFDRSFTFLSMAPSFVMDLGAAGCYDEHGIFPLNVLRVNDELLGYIGGWSRRVAVPVDGSIGIARSKNEGVTFERIGPGPVLSSSINEPFLIGDPFVQRFDHLFHMWYIFGTQWLTVEDSSAVERVYKIGHAISNDGVRWEKPSEGVQIIQDVLGPTESQALPSVAAFAGKYHMVFCFRESIDFRHVPSRAYRLGYAFSTDLVNWTRDDSMLGLDVGENSWDSEMLCYPHLFQVGGKTYLLYNGNEFGRNGFGVAELVAP